MSQILEETTYLQVAVAMQMDDTVARSQMLQVPLTLFNDLEGVVQLPGQEGKERQGHCKRHKTCEDRVHHDYLRSATSTISRQAKPSMIRHYIDFSCLPMTETLGYYSALLTFFLQTT